MFNEEITAAWFVGFFEGDGCFAYNGGSPGRGRKHPVLIINQMERVVLDKLAAWLQQQGVSCNVAMRNRKGLKGNIKVAELTIRSQSSMAIVVPWLKQYLVSDKRKAQFTKWFTQHGEYLKEALTSG